MRIAVCVKHAVDESELRVDPDGRPILDGAPTKMSTFDKNAVEEAIRAKSAQGGDVCVFTVGPSEARRTMKEALAMGADRGVLVTADPSALDSLAIARLLAAALGKAGPFDVVICSEGSSDVYTGLVPPMLGELLNIPYVGYARKIEFGEGRAMVERSLEESVEVVESPIPLLVSVVSEINEPRYPTLIQIMQASKKPVEEWPSAQLLPELTPAVLLASMTVLSVSRKHIMIEGSPGEASEKLLDLLSSEGVLSR